jgi:nitrate reductase NapE component
MEENPLAGLTLLLSMVLFVAWLITRWTHPHLSFDDIMNSKALNVFAGVAFCAFVVLPSLAVAIFGAYAFIAWLLPDEPLAPPAIIVAMALIWFFNWGWPMIKTELGNKRRRREEEERAKQFESMTGSPEK